MAKIKVGGHSSYFGRTRQSRPFLEQSLLAAASPGLAHQAGYSPSHSRWSPGEGAGCCLSRRPAVAPVAIAEPLVSPSLSVCMHSSVRKMYCVLPALVAWIPLTGTIYLLLRLSRSNVNNNNHNHNNKKTVRQSGNESVVSPLFRLPASCLSFPTPAPGPRTGSHARGTRGLWGRQPG